METLFRPYALNPRELEGSSPRKEAARFDWGRCKNFLFTLDQYKIWARFQNLTFVTEGEVDGAETSFQEARPL